VTRTIVLGDAVRKAVQDPAAAWDLLRTRKTTIIVRLVGGRGPRIRRAAARLSDGVASALPRHRRTRTPAALARVLGHHFAGRPREAGAAAVRAAADPRMTDRGALQLAGLCVELGDYESAARIADARPGGPGEDARAVILRADLDWRFGRYASALRRAEAVLVELPGDERAERIARRCRSELTTLEPGWRPAIGSRGRVIPEPGRVLHLLTNSLPFRQAGYTLRSQNVARCQRDAGLDVHMATRAGFPLSDGIRTAPGVSTVDGIPYHHLARDLEPGAGSDEVVRRTADAAADLVAELRPAVLHPTTNYLNAIAALTVGEALGVPVVYEVRGFLEETWLARAGVDVAESERYRAAREAETSCMRGAAAVVTLSETMRSEILERGGVDPARVTVVPNGVDHERFLPGPRDQALAEQLGLESGETVIGYISSFSSYEGIRYLIEATAELRRRGRRARCLLVGDGEERGELEAAARAAGVADGTVLFTGRVPHDQILRYYHLIDVFVVPRTTDRVSQLVTPLKPYEAMATERALVVSGVGALREIVIEGETGRTFTPEDPVDLADVVEPLLADPAERARLGRNAREWVIANRTWRHNGLRYRQLYEQIGVA
jgi:PEP-CTERM/exosortase A-associated glycosyltransferase